MASDGDCPSQFAGQPWSVWTEHLGRDSPISDEEDVDKKPQADAMRLPREDMGLFGHCPERDPFYTVVCEFCNTLVKPQGLRNHIDLWHKVTTADTTHGLEPSEKAIKLSTVVPKTGTVTKPNTGNVKIKVKKPQSSSSTNVPMERLLQSNQIHPCNNNILPMDGVVSLSKGGDKILLQSENVIGMVCAQPLTTAPVSLQVAGLDGGQLPSPVNSSTIVVPVVDLPASCLGSLPTPTSLSPESQTNGLQNSSSDPQTPSFPASDPPVPAVLDLTIDSFESVASMAQLPSKPPVLSSVANFPPGTCHHPRPPEERATLEYVPRLEEVTWLRSPPKPVTVCSFSSRKLGGVEANNRRVELFYHGLKTALTQGCIRLPTLYSVQQRKRFLLLDTSQW